MCCWVTKVAPKVAKTENNARAKVKTAFNRPEWAIFTAKIKNAIAPTRQKL